MLGFETGTLVYKAVTLANTPRRSPTVFFYEHNDSIFTYKQVVYILRTIQPRTRFLTVRIEHIHSKISHRLLKGESYHNKLTSHSYKLTLSKYNVSLNKNDLNFQQIIPIGIGCP